MSKRIGFLNTLLLLAWFGPAGADVPLQVGPFILNRDIAEFEKYLDMRTELPVRYRENIKEVETRPIKGFKNGLVAYGTCAHPGRVVRIKLKYADSSKAFFDNLLSRIEKRYGRAIEYRGDPFHILIGWKWSFVDADGNTISLNLQHNTRDEEEKMGNAVKLTMTNLFEQDCACRENMEQKATRQGQPPMVLPGLESWELFVPR